MRRLLLALLAATAVAAGQASRPATAPAAGGYVVVAVAPGQPPASEAAAFQAVAREAAKFHGGKVVEFDGKAFDELEKTLRGIDPANVLFVIRPGDFDVNFHRRVALMSARMDDDLFADFSFGYLTARDGPALAKLWKRTVALHEKGFASKAWMGTAVAPKFDPIKIEGHMPEIAKAAGFTGGTYFFATKEWKNYSFEKILEHLQRLKEASVISMSGNGDPQGIWVFDGDRNLDETKHWAFDPAKVGHDPKGEMPRVKAAEYRKLGLKGPVVWSGTCHSGATRRVYVEPDIVSTFGRSEKVVLYELAPDEGLCLAWIDAGATALLVPVAANHGMACNLEQDFVLSTGATLGEAARSTLNDVLLQSGGKPKAALKVVGEPIRLGSEDPMQEGALNRVLIGDPALKPFKATKHPLESVEATPVTPRGVDVVVTWKKGFHAWGWDMYGGRRGADWRVPARVPLDGLVSPSSVPPITATVEVKDDAGVVVPFTMTHAVVERDHGRLWLHVQANASRTVAQNRPLVATFKVRW
jgi:hypothetical protein